MLAGFGVVGSGMRRRSAAIIIVA
ncbi:hypothetical protein [Sandarakinorhabdus sp.]